MNNLKKANARMQENAANVVPAIVAELKERKADILYTYIEPHIPFYAYNKFSGTLTEKALVAIRVTNENTLEIVAVDMETEKMPTKEQLENYTGWTEFDPYGSIGILNAFNLSYLFDYIDIAEIA